VKRPNEDPGAQPSTSENSPSRGGSPISGNVALTFDRGGFAGALSWNYQGTRLYAEVNNLNGSNQLRYNDTVAFPDRYNIYGVRVLTGLLWNF